MRSTTDDMATVCDRPLSADIRPLAKVNRVTNRTSGISLLRRTQSASITSTSSRHSFNNYTQERFLSRFKRRFTTISFTLDVSSHRRDWVDLPCYEIQTMSPNTFATFSGPDGGLVNAPSESSNTASTDRKIPKYDWDIHHDRAFGNAVSLYEFNKEQKCRTGSPIADVFAIHATENGAILALADGVNWGPKPRLAAQCGVRGCMEYIQEQFFDNDCHPKNTHEVFKVLRTSLDHGQNLILKTEATLTTICLAVVVQLRKTDQFVLCVANVGDSLAYVYSPSHGVREVTTGCRDLLHDRDLRECGGALGPAVGEDPDLDNLTFSFTMLEHDDVVFLASDGITDNFDPAMAMTARVNDFKFKTLDEKLPLIETADRQKHTTQAMSEMLERSGKHEPGEDTAMMVCGRFIQYVVKLTNPYRDILEKYHARIHENSELTNEERTELDIQRKNAIYTLPGKLDHASIVAFTVGNPQQDCISLKGQEMVVYPP